MALHRRMGTGRFLVVAAIAVVVWATWQQANAPRSTAVAAGAVAQQSSPGAAQTAAASPKATRSTGESSPLEKEGKTARFRPRLPMYYGKVVTREQRERIYAIQRQYWPQIRTLQEQLETLLAQRKAEIEAVLTDEQKAKIAQFKADLAAKRAAARKKRKDAASDETGAQ